MKLYWGVNSSLLKEKAYDLLNATSFAAISVARAGKQ